MLYVYEFIIKNYRNYDKKTFLEISPSFLANEDGDRCTHAIGEETSSFNVCLYFTFLLGETETRVKMDHYAKLEWEQGLYI